MFAGQTGQMTGQMGHVHGTDGTLTRGCPAKILYVYWFFLSPRKSLKRVRKEHPGAGPPKKVPKECAPQSQKSPKRVQKSGFRLFSGPKEPWQPQTWQDLTRFSPQHFPLLSPDFRGLVLLNCTQKLEKKAKNPVESLQWRRRPEIADFCPLSWSNLSWSFQTLSRLRSALFRDSFGKDQKGLHKRGIHDQGEFWKFPLETTV